MNTPIRKRAIVRGYAAPPGSPKKDTENPCWLCGWSANQAIHTNPQLNGRNGPYHEYESAEPSKEGE